MNNCNGLAINNDKIEVGTANKKTSRKKIAYYTIMSHTSVLFILIDNKTTLLTVDNTDNLAE